jgi:hypothetical protein
MTTRLQHESPMRSASVPRRAVACPSLIAAASRKGNGMQRGPALVREDSA